MRQQPSKRTAVDKRESRGETYVRLKNVFYLTIKELRSIRSDFIVLILVAYAFTFAIYTIATGTSTEPVNLTVGIVDEDHSDLSRRFFDVLSQPPLFKPATLIGPDEVDSNMDAGHLIFVLEIPPRFEQDLLAGRQASLQLNIDATAMAPAGNGSIYIQSILLQEVYNFLARREMAPPAPVNVVTHVKFNPNLYSFWFTSVMQVINNITILAVILTGAALIREREHGTIEHLLVMPVVPWEIMMAKTFANGLVILIGAALSLTLVGEMLLGVPIAGSVVLFIAGAALYTITVAALGILMGTVVNTMGQFALLCTPSLVIMYLLSGSTTPMESMPVWLRYLMLIVSPTPHFVAFSQAILYRGAGLSIVWPQLGAMVAIGSLYFAFSLGRFRRAIFGD